MKSENNLKSIAKRTGVSISTVSRVLSGKHEQYRISAGTVRRVMNEAKRVNYKPSFLAQSLRTKKTYTIGLVVPSLSNHYFASIASEIIFEARQYGYIVILLDTFEDEENERECINTLLTRNIDGMILVPCGERADFLEEIDQQTPLVLVDRYFEETSLSYVHTDNYQGALDGVNLLIEHGHQRIHCIQGVPHSMPSRERVRGYMDALRASGHGNLSQITGSDYSVTNGYLETKLAIGSPLRPTAIFALSNTILLGAIRAIGESSLRIPDDISILSFDNSPFLDFLHPAITRISQPIKEIGQLAVKILIERLSNNQSVRQQIQLPAQIINGNSIKRL